MDIQQLRDIFVKYVINDHKYADVGVCDICMKIVITNDQEKDSGVCFSCKNYYCGNCYNDMLSQSNANNNNEPVCNNCWCDD